MRLVILLIGLAELESLPAISMTPSSNSSLTTDANVPARPLEAEALGAGTLSPEPSGGDLPAARLGRGIMVDQGTGVVIGETAVVEDGVSILQGVTLGGTGKEAGDRHPKIRTGAVIGAGASVLGNIEVGARAKIGAGSVVLKPVPAGTTAAGVPARIVGRAGAEPAREMDQSFGEDSG
jgi:acetyltransferase-like isoleucine patch superfamily enzyme